MKNYCAYKLDQIFDQHRFGCLTVTFPNGMTKTWQGEARTDLVAHWHIHAWRVLLAVFCSGDIGLGHTYIQGLWTSDDVLTLLTVLNMNNDLCYQTKPSLYRLHALLDRFYQNSIRGSQKNIQAHYDVGNDFYKHWLDPEMVYSSALFENIDMTLAEAQQCKLQRILSHLPKSAQRILEIGCGWGGFMRLADLHGHHVKGLTLSPSQKRYCDGFTYANGSRAFLQDYRHEKETHDAIVSIEMFEAVGQQYWPTYFRTIKKALNAQGTAVVQTIHLDQHNNVLPYAETSDFIRRFVFPGGFLPTVAQFKTAAEAEGLIVVAQQAFGDSYAETLKRWHTAMLAHQQTFLDAGRTPAMLRCWSFYLLYCIVAFESQICSVSQFVLKHRQQDGSV